ncbi:MAG TPA: hypothetical protein VFI23_02610 [Rhizomicrobium sp.]|nr:hypothetical protein [Rhizomicrobium sp.]
MLEAACRDFETLDKLLRKEVQLSGPGFLMQELAAIQMALAQSFLFYTVRARRIVDHGAAGLRIERAVRKAFLTATSPVVDVRNVNEHGVDPVKSGRGKVSRSTLHFQGNSWGDETSLTYDAPRILMGPIDLREMYVPVAALRAIAGFSSLAELAPGAKCQGHASEQL